MSGGMRGSEWHYRMQLPSGLLGGGGGSIITPPKIVFDGDSSVSGWRVSDSTDNIPAYSYFLTGAIDNGLTYNNKAIAGTRVRGQPTGAPVELVDAARVAIVDALYNSGDVYCCGVGTNDLYDIWGSGTSPFPGPTQIDKQNQLVAAIKAHLAGRKAVGYKTVYSIPWYHPSMGGTTNWINFYNAILADATFADYIIPAHLEVTIGDSRNAAGTGNARWVQSDNSHGSAELHTLESKISGPILVSAINGRIKPVWATFVSTLDDGAIYQTAESTDYLGTRAGTAGTLGFITGTIVGNWSKPLTTYQFYEGFANFPISGVAGYTAIGASLGFVNTGTVSNAQAQTAKWRIKDYGAGLAIGDFVAGADLAALPLVGTALISAGWLSSRFNPVILDSGFVAQIPNSGNLRMIHHLGGQEGVTAPTGTNSVNHWGSGGGSDKFKLFVIYQPP